jgi:sporulation protein YlmC with PRC-barrel domain
MTKTIESGVLRGKDLGLVYWARGEAKEAVTNDGKMVGLVRGILADPKTWTIPFLVVEGNKDALEKLNIEKPLGGELVILPTKFVKEISYMVELNTDLASMKGKISKFNPEQP